MARFNAVAKGSTKTTTYEGGQAFTRTLEDEWTNMLFGYLFQKYQPSFYENSFMKEERFSELSKEMIEKHGAEFVGKAAIFSRNVLGMRSISSYLASILNGYKFDKKRTFFREYFHRPDDVAEVFASIQALGQKRSHALIRGACDYISSLNDYQLGKYKLNSHEFNMYDLIQLTHSHSESIDKYLNNILELPDTWEVRISTASNEEERNKEWSRLVEEHKLGYLALIRNLRNICSMNHDLDWYKKYLIPQIENEKAIRSSLVFPYQIYVSYKQASRSIIPIELELALSNAFKISVNNIPEFSGKSLIVEDVSGSMCANFSNHSYLTIGQVSSAYAIGLYLSNNDFDLMKFGTNTKLVHYPKNGNVFSLIDSMCDNEYLGHGTYINDLISSLDKHYDRIFLFSDMQVMSSIDSANSHFSRYTEKYGQTRFYSFDLGFYDNQIVSQDKNIVYLTALNDNIFSCINIFESGKSIIDIINDTITI